ncbi:hypothetical protein [Negadavirga shengliensis]|uniref:Uncharacterized protein n=1 Tax=Negadavirga shengliensis TaxID=1389218 RepID=A0ABV9SYH5_9BACT
MKITRKIYQGSPLLTWFGLANFMVFLVLLVLSFFDERTLLGINIWIKPIKFCISIAVFSWTMAWFLGYLPQRRQTKHIAFWIALMLFVEQVIIIGQAARGEISHFNTSTPFNAALFNIMGLAILINTIMVFWAYRLFGKAAHLAKGYRRGIRLGMLIFIVASLEGYVMAAQLGHTVGASDGQEGIFFLNWAKQYGDLRIFHFLGLHAIQIIPLFAWFISPHRTLAVNLFAFFYFIFSLGTLWNALLGHGIYFNDSLFSGVDWPLINFEIPRLS